MRRTSFIRFDESSYSSVARLPKPYVYSRDISSSLTSGDDNHAPVQTRLSEGPALFKLQEAMILQLERLWTKIGVTVGKRWGQ